MHAFLPFNVSDKYSSSFGLSRFIFSESYAGLSYGYGSIPFTALPAALRMLSGCCTDGYSCRFRADHLNEVFVNELKKYMVRPEIIDLFKIMITEAWYDQTNHLQNDTKQLRLQIKELEEKLSYIRGLLSSKQIEPGDFREIKTTYSSKLEKLEAKLTTCNLNEIKIKDLLEKGINNMLKLDYLYEIADIEKKREIISSMYPEKMTFDGFTVRTNRINEAAKLIYSMDLDFSENKNRTNQKNSSLSCQVGMTSRSRYPRKYFVIN